MNRRAFVAAGAGFASAALLRGSADSPVPAWPNGSTSLPLEPAELKRSIIEIGPFKFSEKQQFVRPLMSELLKNPSPGPLQKLTNQLNTAYTTLAANSTPAAGRNKGYVRDVWTHQYACEGGSFDIHNTWSFLPWHRGFLYFHERLIRSFGMDDFRLPVWDWENLQEIPRPYANWQCTPLLDRTPSPSFQDITDPSHVQAWLLTPEGDYWKFLGYNSGSGAVPQASAGPHAGVHSRVGGFMLDPGNAAADPLFFAHHTNVDRWWEVWRRRYEPALIADPQYQKWLNQSLTFFDHLATDSQGKARPGWVSVTVSQLLDIHNLGYEYGAASRLDLPHFTALASEAAENADREFVRRLDCGDFIAKLQSLRLAPNAAMPSGALSLIDIADLFKRLGDFTLAVAFQAMLNPEDGPGYYVLGVKGMTNGSKPIVLGGFGVFSSSGHQMAEASARQRRVAGSFGLPSGKVRDLFVNLLAQNQTYLEFQAVYAPANGAGLPVEFPANGKPLGLAHLEFRFPDKAGR